jgi:hypothetical protein
MAAWSRGNGWVKRDRRQKRLSMIRHLGGLCCKCGFSDYRALQIDHKNGGGSSRVTLSTSRSGNYNKFYDEVMKDNSIEFQLLCANCNAIKKFENAEGCNDDLNKVLLAAMEKDQKLQISLC